MHSGAFLRNLKLGALVITSLASAAVAHAQLTLDLTADSGTTIDGTNPGHVTAWADQSGSGLNVSQTTASAEPALVTGALNGHSVLHFDGSDAMSRNSVLGSQLIAADQGTMFFVITPQTPSTESGQAPLAWFGGTSSALIGYTDDGNNLKYVHGTQGQVPGDLIQASQPTGWYGNTHIVTMVRNTDGSGSIRVDGAPLSTSGSFANTIDTTSSGGLFIGPANSGGFLGDIAEVRVYNAGLSAGSISTIESSLATTYGLTIVPEPSQYATVFALACLVGAVYIRRRSGASVVVR